MADENDIMMMCTIIISAFVCGGPKILLTILILHTLQFIEFMAWFINFHELHEFLEVYIETCPNSYSRVHEKIDIQIHKLIGFTVFIFMGL